ncbi:mechanosensitive ion channel family protein [Ramlibacter rhizophilus]|uniref:Mechanosensitive ion channel family protein n=1 Tax=Ramlibacter rhizophilus TaxID=1781167 RepID=A0A4Z0BD95_9BURK|nr:mechanosensitive ion channel family protein [Ramlibacter rhizophilus]TFY97276.1 mechanosensitive ion channel family protein [Ramlibacter rhizophilus]
MQELIDWLHQTQIAGVSLFSIGLALLIAVVAYTAMVLGLRFAASRLRRFSKRTATPMDDVVVNVLESTNHWLLLVAALLIGLDAAELGPRWAARVGQLWFIAIALQLGLWTTRAIKVGVRNYELRHHGNGSQQVSASGTLLTWFLRTVLWAVILLAVLSNLGVNITAFVASLGVGGIAVALAVQNILGDLFASLSIAVDKPFEVGDFISSDAGTGTVEYVGLKTTRIRALSGEQIVVGNTELLKQPVKNFRRMRERRIAFKFGVTYGTEPALAEAIPGIVKDLVEADTLLRFDRAHFQGFGDSSLDYEVVYHVLDPAYNLYMDAQQRLNLGLLRAFAAKGIEFAFPTRTLYLAGAGSQEREGEVREAVSA